MESLLIAAIDVLARETMMFACAGLLIGGIDDVALDLVFWWSRLRRRPAGQPPPAVSPGAGGPIAVFVPAWDESAVIAPMLATTLARFGDDRFRLYVGAYPNDRATIDVVVAVAERDARVRLVVNPLPGPTTKADSLNCCWEALLREERGEQWRAIGVVLHDAEDVVHRDELAVFRRYLSIADVVQLPVLPLADARSPLIAGHYCDEFAESHGKTLIAREVLGAALPLAGVGCAIARDLLGRIADGRDGRPFDAASLTEDYELGLLTASLGARQAFARMRDDAGQLIAVREYFPATLDGAVRQKARWMVGIALAGWDRVGWGRPLDWREHWMRMRDRRAPLAMLVLLAAYLALLGWGASTLVHALTGTAPPDPGLAMSWLLRVNAGLLGWRLAMRVLFTWRAYGPVEAAWSVPRVFVANCVALLAARRAMWRYVATLRGAPTTWEKTQHRFPDILRETS
ncbi:glycosyl transferase family protein [uncultured Sphingomonas sp.]|uniref:glycosyl transferase family protein n=1 Tax=uncultured Sphingomonas sp. TaxID=158754 RepID=UPI0035C99317